MVAAVAVVVVSAEAVSIAKIKIRLHQKANISNAPTSRGIFFDCPLIIISLRVEGLNG